MPTIGSSPRRPRYASRMQGFGVRVPIRRRSFALQKSWYRRSLYRCTTYSSKLTSVERMTVKGLPCSCGNAGMQAAVLIRWYSHGLTPNTASGIHESLVPLRARLLMCRITSQGKPCLFCSQRETSLRQNNIQLFFALLSQFGEPF